MSEPSATPGTPGTHAHEDRDLGARAIVGFFVGLCLLIAAAMLAMWLLFDLFESRVERADIPSWQAVLPTERGTAPRLEMNPGQDLRDVRAEERVLDSYGWVDRAKGVVRIPRARALELVAERGLPAREDRP